MSAGRSAAAAAEGLQVFTGGTGRSGTTVTCRMLGEHPALAVAPVLEVKFITGARGLLDLVLPFAQRRAELAAAGIAYDSPQRVQRFLADLRTKYYRRQVIGSNRLTGLHRAITEQELTEAIERFETSWAAGGRTAAARVLIEAIMGAMAARAGRPGWADSTPANALNAARLHQVLPRAKVLNMVRDGRDVAVSVAGMPWGPDDPFSALQWWADRMRRGHRALAQVPTDRVLTIHLEDLITRDREGSYRRILQFLDLPDAPQMRTFFTERMPPAAGHGGRWANELDAADSAALDRAYRQMRAELTEEGVDVPALE